MRKIIVTEFISLDGVIEDPGGAEGYKHGGWTFKFSDEEVGPFKFGELMEADAQLLGRVTYDGFAAAWPNMEDDGAGFKAKMNAMPKYVVSSTLKDPGWQNSTVISLDDVERLDGTLLVAGSATLAQALHARGLVDEYRLVMFPVVLGTGKKLFGESDDLTTYALADSKVLGSGTLLLTYQRA
jgi:dihydrofolate reductase